MPAETDSQQSSSVTALVEGEKGCVSKERLLASILESSDDAIIGKTLEGTILVWNAAAEKLYGYSAAEAVGQDISFIVPPERQAEIAQILERIRRGEPVDHHETARLRKDGTRVDVSLTVSPIRNEAGKIIGTSSIGRDISERKRAQRAKVESEKMLRSLFEFAPDAILVLDREGRILRVNGQAERIFGYQREQMVGQSVEVLMPGRFRDRHVEHLASYMAAPHMRPMGVGLDLYAMRKDGTEFAVDIMLSPVQTREAGIVIAVVRDITERKRTEQQIREALKKEVVLRREIHHRVKNNLQVISSLLFLQSTHVTDPNTLEVLRESQDRARSIALIHEKLYHSTDLTKVEFCDYVKQLVCDLFHVYRVNPETVALEIKAEGVSLDVDTAISCGLIINELVSNALKHGLPAGTEGKIWIDLEQSEGGLLMLRVRDNGVGLPEQFDLQTTRTLGLKLVSDLARQLDGTIEFERNDGTAVKITFAEPA